MAPGIARNAVRVRSDLPGLKQAVQALMECGHPHHFVVYLDWHYLLVSPTAVECLKRNIDLTDRLAIARNRS